MSESGHDKESIVDTVVQRLSARFPTAPRPRIEGIVGEQYDSLADGRVKIYIPTLIEHGARTRLNQEFDFKANEVDL